MRRDAPPHSVGQGWLAAVERQSRPEDAGMSPIQDPI
jgi:hypothetical protein